MTAVVDASSVVAYLLGEASDDERRAMLEEPHAPALVDIEATQTFRGLVRGSKIDLATAELGCSELALLGVRRHPAAPLLRRAWELRDMCTVYDALYVALAEALDAALHTRDARLAAAVGDSVDVIVSA
jgi:predicted nucleic acid-binding protein